MTGRVLILAVAGFLGAAILLGLGFWQLDRLSWKQALVADLAARLAAQPVEVPDDANAARDRLLRVEASGLLGNAELHVITSMRPWGPGYRAISPMVMEDGRRVMVDLGFVPQDLKDPASRAPEPATPPETVVGLLHWPAETDGFTPDPDLDRNIWFARDVEAMARALDTQSLMIIAESHPRAEWPRPDPPAADLPNRHLEYAATWFMLAAVWVVMAGLLIRTEIRGRRPPPA